MEKKIKGKKVSFPPGNFLHLGSTFLLSLENRIPMVLESFKLIVSKVLSANY